MFYRKKAYAYIVRGDELLIFREQLDGRDDFAQLPGGTVEEGESIEEALLREVYEESRLSDVSIIRLLGCDVVRGAIDRIDLRHFFLVRSNEPMKDSWLHYEEHGSEHDYPLPFLYSWMPIEEARLGMGGDHHKFLGSI
jgi:ADP-ribose pyrophosphatase YjhB (NUDIX family)